MAKYDLNMGTRLKLGSAATGTVTYTDIPYLRNIPGLALEEDKIEVTHNQSTTREYVPSGLQDPGDYSFEMETDRTNATHQDLFTIWKNKTPRKFRLIYPDGLAYEFTAYVQHITRADYDAQSPDVIIDTVALSINGDITDVSDALLNGG